MRKSYAQKLSDFLVSKGVSPVISGGKSLYEIYKTARAANLCAIYELMGAYSCTCFQPYGVVASEKVFPLDRAIELGLYRPHRGSVRRSNAAGAVA